MVFFIDLIFKEKYEKLKPIKKNKIKYLIQNIGFIG